MATNLDNEVAAANEFFTVVWGVIPGDIAAGPAPSIAAVESLFGQTSLTSLTQALKSGIAANPNVGLYKLVSAPTSEGDSIFLAVLMVLPSGGGLPYAQILAPLQSIAFGSLGLAGNFILIGGDYADPGVDAMYDATTIAAQIPSVGGVIGGAVAVVVNKVLQELRDAVAPVASAIPWGYIAVAALGALWVYKRL